MRGDPLVSPSPPPGSSMTELDSLRKKKIKRQTFHIAVCPTVIEDTGYQEEDPLDL